MSKNIVIQEGGVGRQLTVNKLKTNLVSGGSCLWVPEDDVQLTTKTITENGTYKAVTDGYYGYSDVTVSGIGKATGTGPDGEDHEYSEDGTGGVTDNVLPYRISVVTPPTVLTYADGAAIDFSGMVVKAYLKSGSLWTDIAHPDGVIPISDLILPVTKAERVGPGSSEWSDGQGINATLVSYTQHWDMTDQGVDYYHWLSTIVIGDYYGNPALWGGSGPTQFFATIYNNNLYTWGATSAQNLNIYEDRGATPGRYSLVVGSTATCSTGGATIAGDATGLQNISVSTVEPQGTPSLQPVGGTTQTIPVQLLRSDGRTLESSFDITVT